MEPNLYKVLLSDNESFSDRASDFSYVTGLKGEKYFFKKKNLKSTFSHKCLFL